MGDIEKSPPDGWRWVILPTAFFNMLLHVSINYNCGVINEALIDTFEADAVETSWLMSYYCALFAIASPLASAAILLTDTRTCMIVSGLLGLVGFAASSLVDSLPVLYITLGFTGIAISLGQSGSVLSLSYYFPDNLPLVHGVCLAGSGMGSFIHPVLTQMLLDSYGFYGTMLLLGGIAFQSSFLGMLLRPNYLEVKSKRFLEKREQSKWKIVCAKIIPPADIFKIPAFAVLIPATFLYSVAFQSMVVILPSYIKRYVGLSIQEGSVAAMVFGAGTVASRLFSGVAASDENIGPGILLVGLTGLLSVLSFCGKLIMEMHQGAYIYSFFFGFYSGGVISLVNSMLMEIVGIELSAHAYGVIMFIFGVAGFTGPPVLALLVKNEGPNMMFTMCGILSVAVSALGLMVSYLKKFTTNSSKVRDVMTMKDVDIYISDDGRIKNDNCMESDVLWKNDNLHEVKNDENVIMNKSDTIPVGEGRDGDAPAIYSSTVTDGEDVHKLLLRN